MGASSERYVAEQEAEERLRDAAPDLLAALKSVCDQAIAHQHDPQTRLHDIWDVARAAIHKATWP